MKESLVRGISGFVYIALLLLSFLNEHTLILIFFIFGLICTNEFKKLVQIKHWFPYLLFTTIYFIFGYWKTLMNSGLVLEFATQILHVLNIFVLVLLSKDLFTKKTIPLSNQKKYILSTFYISSAFVFLILITRFNGEFNPFVLLGSFILVWVNDTFAYLIGKNFGKQKLFSSVSPKKTLEGFLGGVLFACIVSYIISLYYTELSFTSWLILSIIVSIVGTIGDLVESKFKRQAQVKDSGNIMPGHGGMLDRLDSIIFAAPFIYLFLRILQDVS